jgi:hypothetical protein
MNVSEFRVSVDETTFGKLSPGLKPGIIGALYAALKRRSSTVFSRHFSHTSFSSTILFNSIFV